MINVAMDVHVRNSLLNARDDQGRALAGSRSSNALGELSQALRHVERSVSAVVSTDDALDALRVRHATDLQ